MVRRGDRCPHALHAKSAEWMQAKRSGPTRPGPSSAANGAWQTLQDVRWSGAMIPQPGQILMPLCWTGRGRSLRRAHYSIDSVISTSSDAGTSPVVV
jgi:hypothetical protein